MKEFSLSKVFQLLEPGPVVLVTTAHKGHSNVMTMSWHTMMEFEPPLVGCVISPMNYSYKLLRASKECVIAIPTVDLARRVVDIGNCSGEDVEKFASFGLTTRRGEQVGCPLILECVANLECRIADGRWAQKYAFFVLEVVKAWKDTRRKEKRTIHANGDGTFVVDGRTINLRRRMTKWKDML